MKGCRKNCRWDGALTAENVDLDAEILAFGSP